MSREELAEASGIPAATIAGYENAENVPSLKNAWKMADAFNLPLDEMFERNRKSA